MPSLSDKTYDFLTALVKYVVGPLLAFALAKGCSDANHAQSVKGYEVVASSLNDEVGKQLNDLEHRLTSVEQAPASLPSSMPLRRVQTGLGGVQAPRPVRYAPRRQLVPRSLAEAAK